MSIGSIAGFGFCGYKNFDQEDVIHTFFGIERLNLIVGVNNVGKSNVLRFLSDVMPVLRDPHSTLGDFLKAWGEQPKHWIEDKPVVVRLGFVIESIPAEILTWLEMSKDELSAIREFTLEREGEIWLDLVPDDSDDAEGSELRFQLSDLQLGAWLAAKGLDGPWFIDADIYLKVWQAPPSTSPAHFFGYFPLTVGLSAHRRITAEDPPYDVSTGKALVSRLAELQNPDPENREAQQRKFNVLQQFLQKITREKNLIIEVPYSRDTIILEGTFGVRTLGSFGTGLEELVILGVAASVHDGALLCIEEPELHLHPVLQRQLLEFVSEQTDNYYFMTTHSATMLNADISAIFRVSLDGKSGQVEPVALPSQLADVVRELGNRASDLVQSNFIIWVEGPSDRIYVVAWIAAADSGLKENIHFTVMFYGGALLSHLMLPDGEEVNELISLIRINRNLAILIDSDRRIAGARLNATKERIIAEAVKLGQLAWVTEGYTIENYIPVDLLQQAVDEVHPNSGFTVPEGEFTSPLSDSDDGFKPNKVAIARKVVALSSTYKPPIPIPSQVIDIVDRIKLANGLLFKKPEDAGEDFDA